MFQCITSVSQLTARQDYLNSLRQDLTRYMELCSEVEVKLGSVSSTLDKHNLWLSNSLDGGLQEQLDITKVRNRGLHGGRGDYDFGGVL